MERNAGQQGGGFTSLRQGTTNSADVAAYYDAWATGYDETLRDWNYQAPDDATALMAPHLSRGARVLDVGCGTGLLGAALQRQMPLAVEGIDISRDSLHLAGDRGVYGRLVHHDLQNIPLPFPEATFDAAASVGVLTYIEDALALLADLCRIVRPGGVIAFTQRSDLWAARDFPALIAGLEAAGTWQRVHVSAPRDYLPGNAEFGDEVRVIHTLCKVGPG